MSPQVIDNFLPEADYKALREYIQAQPMMYGSKSNSRTDPHGHWSWKPVHDSRHNLADLTDKLPQQATNAWNLAVGKMLMQNPQMANPAVIRCYANGYTYGTDGYFHTDSQRDDEHTIIIYICDKWEEDWAGETVWVCNELAGGYACVLPHPNRAVILPSNRMHCARAVSRKCTDLRTTFMYKVRARRSPVFEALSQWLVVNGALSLDHEQGSLHDHLVRVFAILEKAMLPTPVCFAGGLHSIYGTNVYQGRLFDSNAATARSKVASFFGQQAEALVFLFSILDRPKCFEEYADIASEPYLGTMNARLRYDQSVAIPGKVYHNLCLIECANLLDQGSLGKWPKLSKLWEETCKGLQPF